MNRKGQALVEFVLILPVFLIILFTIIDFGVILQRKNNLENTSTEIARMIRNGQTIEEIKQEYHEIEVNLDDYKENYQKIEVTDHINLITPILERILGNPYSIKVERIILNEQ